MRTNAGGIASLLLNLKGMEKIEKYLSECIQTGGYKHLLTVDRN